MNELRNLIVSYEKALSLKSELMGEYRVTKDKQTKLELFELMRSMKKIRKLITKKCGFEILQFQYDNKVYHIVDGEIYRIDLDTIKVL